MLAALVYTLLMLGSPITGQSVQFVGTFPQDARQKIGPQQHYNPVVQTNCSDGFVGTVPMQDESRNADGSWTGTTYPLLLTSPAGIVCSSVLAYWDKDPQTHELILHTLGSVSFVTIAA